MNLRAPKNVRFECQRCARCCGDTSHRGRNILLLEAEVERISKQKGLRPLSFALPISNGRYQYKMKKRNGKCIFLEGKACGIYNIRPIICQFYPFSLNRNNGAHVFEVAKDCAGIGLGEQISKEYFESLVEKATKCMGTGTS